MALHNSAVMAHGGLRSSKCLIDSRWVCKVCDYGLDSVKANQKMEKLGEFAQGRGAEFKFVLYLYSSNRDFLG